MKKVVIVGAGGHAQVLADLIGSVGEFSVLGFLDDQIEPGTAISDFGIVLGNVASLTKYTDCLVVLGIGNNAIRSQLADVHASLNWITLIHPKAIVSASAKIGEGTVVLPGAVVAANASIGKHTIVNANVVVDHDASVGDFCHLKIGSMIGSNSTIGNQFATEIGGVIPAFSNIQS
jgi:acetyltransferase EpsM